MKIEKVLLLVIVLIGLYFRLYKIDSPIADWHSWRQADTAAVSRNFYKYGFNPFVPRYDDMSSVSEPSRENRDRYRFVEFPIYNSIVYFVYLINSGVSEKLARLVSVFFSLGSIVLIYYIAKNAWGKITGFLAAFIFASLPFSVYFSRVVLPEPSLIFFCLGLFYFANRWVEKKGLVLFIIAVTFTILAFLTKPTAIFYLLPLVYSYRSNEGKWLPMHPRYFWFAAISLIPFFAWRAWMQLYPSGIPASHWLLNGNGIRFKPVFWKWILQDRFGREILSVAGTILFSIGVLSKSIEEKSRILYLLALSMLAYLMIIATGNVMHDYYQTFILPVVCIFTARGVLILIKGIPGFLPRLITIPVAIFLLGMMYYLTWAEVKGFYQINNNLIVIAGEVADKILPKNALVLAPYGGDTAFLYQTNRAGLPYPILPMNEMVTKYDITHYVSINFDNKTNWVARNYEILAKTSQYLIADLTKPILKSKDIIDPEPY